MEDANRLAPRPRGAAALPAAAAVAIGVALAVSHGRYDPAGLALIGLGIVLAWGGLFFNFGPRWAVAIGLAGMALYLCLPPPMELSAPSSLCWIALPILAIAAAGAIALPRYYLPLFLLTHFLVGAWLLRSSPLPLIDVYEVTKDACAALTQRHNPYAIDFPDVYAGHPDWEKAFYSPGTITGGRANFGYPYMPLSLLVGEAGYLIGGDFRLGHLLAITLAGALIGYARPGRRSAAAACLFLLTPAGYYIIEYGWSEPTVILCLAGVVFCASRFPAGLPWAVGLLLVSKQYLFLALPIMPLLMPRPWQWKTSGMFILKAVLIGAAMSLPLILWNFPAFWHSTIEVQIHNPFRFDSLNFTAAWVKAGNIPPPQWVAFATALAAGVVALYRAPRGGAGFAAGVAVIYLVFFATSKQAFGNYYYFTISALCCATGTE